MIERISDYAQTATRLAVVAGGAVLIGLGLHNEPGYKNPNADRLAAAWRIEAVTGAGAELASIALALRRMAKYNLASRQAFAANGVADAASATSLPAIEAAASHSSSTETWRIAHDASVAAARAVLSLVEEQTSSTAAVA